MGKSATNNSSAKCFYKVILLFGIVFFTTLSNHSIFDIISLNGWSLNAFNHPGPLPRFVIRGKACLNDSIYLGLKEVVKPPKLNSTQFAKQLQLFRRHISANRSHLASHYLSTIVQKQIAEIQEMSCDGPNLQCGHQDSCGFGCQMHHRIACLMMSYITQLPLIHTPDCDGWGYLERWTDVLQPLGSKCSPGNRTIVWRWTSSKPLAINECGNSSGKDISRRRIPYPLQYGIPLDPKLADMIQSLLSPDPFLWIVGQFTKYVMKWNPTFEEMVTDWKSQIGFSNSGNGTPIVGIQVRRSDKVLESNGSVHPITVYMDEVETYFQGLEVSQGLQNNSLKRRVYVASDSISILRESRKIHPDWEILGRISRYSEDYSSRRHGLFEIARDVILLSQSDFVICGFSSNVCRLVYEMQTYLKDSQRTKGRPSRHRQGLKSLDGEYDYVLLYHGLSPNYNMRIYTIDC